VSYPNHALEDQVRPLNALQLQAKAQQTSSTNFRDMRHE
jgi:hypothetical protein